ncbi:alpha/beta-hydrolase [Gonapodya prolifera JEL478]|uniref:sn-1-specific diacylglycerol lipase n=1 Tax=Gonapodya prolifera (strain JEL478) TaxID=1344416 RepID=A0A139B0P7_GONPJ|nr:alpha/beta-hydrolase [Gonapodya prolifera JEL478]|eukprot:KXS22549.1 alpha/beta-hydrolase [Gonapodya prolifera JEL478]
MLEDGDDRTLDEVETIDLETVGVQSTTPETPFINPVSSILRFAHSIAHTSITLAELSTSMGIEASEAALKAIDHLVTSRILESSSSSPGFTMSHTGVFRLLVRFMDMLDEVQQWTRDYPNTTLLQKITALRAYLAIQAASRDLRYPWDMPGARRVNLLDLRRIEWFRTHPDPTTESTSNHAAFGTSQPAPPVHFHPTHFSDSDGYNLLEGEIGTSENSAPPNSTPAATPSGSITSSHQQPCDYLQLVHRAMTMSYAAYGKHAHTFFEFWDRAGWDFGWGSGTSRSATGNEPWRDSFLAGSVEALVGADSLRQQHTLQPPNEVKEDAASVPAEVAGAVDIAEHMVHDESVEGEEVTDGAGSFPEQTGLSPPDLQSPNEQNTNHPLAYHPTFLLLVDHQTRCIFLVLRGTMSPHDVLVDLNARAVPFEHPSLPALPLPPSRFETRESSGTPYMCHEGMLDAARAIAQPDGVVLRELAKAMEKWEDYHVVVCGHSLGAGIATLVATILADPAKGVTLSHQPIPADRPISCLAFASPCVTSLQLSAILRGDSTSPFVTSIMVGLDPIPRLCVVSVRDIKRRVGELCLDATLGADALARSGGSLGGDEQKCFLETLNDIKTRATERAHVGSEDEPEWGSVSLYPAGRTLWLRHNVSDDDVRGSGDTWSVFDVVNLEAICSEMELGRDAMWEHMPHTYANALRQIASRNSEATE